VKAVCFGVLEPFLRGISFPVWRDLFLAREGSGGGGGWYGMLVSFVISEGEGLGVRFLAGIFEKLVKLVKLWGLSDVEV
jgi:hypothetical protein